MLEGGEGEGEGEGKEEEKGKEKQKQQKRTARRRGTSTRSLGESISSAPSFSSIFHIEKDYNIKW